MHPDNYFDDENENFEIFSEFNLAIAYRPCLGRSSRILIHVLRIIDVKN